MISISSDLTCQNDGLVESARSEGFGTIVDGDEENASPAGTWSCTGFRIFLEHSGFPRCPSLVLYEGGGGVDSGMTGVSKNGRNVSWHSHKTQHES